MKPLYCVKKKDSTLKDYCWLYDEKSTRLLFSGNFFIGDKEATGVGSWHGDHIAKYCNITTSHFDGRIEIKSLNVKDDNLVEIFGLIPKGCRRYYSSFYRQGSEVFQIEDITSLSENTIRVTGKFLEPMAKRYVLLTKNKMYKVINRGTNTMELQEKCEKSL